MKKVILTKGLPGSGKTYWAKQYQRENPNTVLVNKDDLRAMLHQSVWSKGREEFILKVRDFIILQALSEGHDVIVHDTNLSVKHWNRIKSILPVTKEGIELQWKDFTSVPIEVCIKQDLQRVNSVGEKVIRDMWKQFLKPDPEVYSDVEGRPTCVICDLDGTLALFGDANPYDRDFLQDKPNMRVYEILHRVMDTRTIFIVSGRKDIYKEQTKQWLKQNGIPYDYLLMRKGDDNRKDVIVKQEIFEAEIKNKYNVLFVLDDRNQVVEYWRSQGLMCLQVAEGDF